MFNSKGNLIINILLCFCFLSFKAFSVELIQTPKGVLIRSIPEWEGIKTFEVKTDERIFEIENADGRLQALLSDDDLCKNPAYRIATSLNHKEVNDWQSLSHLCQDNQSDQMSFVFISDTQLYHEFHERTAKLVNKFILNDRKKIRFIINAGDIVQTGNEKEWKAYRNIASKYYTSLVPIIPVIGNHDYREDPSLNLEKFVYGTEETQRNYYYIDLGKIVVIVLNSNVDLLPSETKKAQTNWLKDTLIQFYSEKPIIMTYHHPIFTSGFGVFPISSNPDYMERNWLPLFKEYGVSLVLNGHEHLYERLLVDDIVCIVAGPAAGRMYAFNIINSEYTKFVLPFVRTLSAIDVSDNGDFYIETHNSQSSNGLIVDKVAF